MSEKTNGTLFIVAAPSGGGKTSLVRVLVGSMEAMAISVSHTTRKMRPGEQDGIHYFFIDQSEFMQMVNDNAFIEHAKVFEHYYGTSEAQIKNRLAEGIDVVLDIDWQGAQQIKRIFPDSVSIFIIPPSLGVLRERLIARGQDEPAVIDRRMQQAQEEMSHYGEFDYVVVNDEFDHASRDLQAIVRANRLKTAKQSVRQRQLLSFLLGSQ